MWLVEGRLAYSGPVNQMTNYFAALGYTCPKFMNPADFVATLLIRQPGADEEEYSKRIDSVVAHHKEHNNIIPVEGYQLPGVSPDLFQRSVQDEVSARMKSKAPSFYMQFWLLLTRTWTLYMREPALTWQRLIQYVFIALFIGLLFLQISNSQSGSYLCTNSLS